MFKKRNSGLITSQEKISEKTNFVVLRNTVVHNVLNRLTCLMYNVNVSPHMTCIRVRKMVRVFVLTFNTKIQTKSDFTGHN